MMIATKHLLVAILCFIVFICILVLKADSLLGQSEMILRETLSIVIKRAMQEAYGDLG